MGRAYFLGILGLFAVTVTVCYGVPTAPDGIHPLGDEMINFINNVIRLGLFTGWKELPSRH